MDHFVVALSFCFSVFGIWDIFVVQHVEWACASLFRYLAHAEVLAGVLTTTANEDPRILQHPLLLLTHLSLHAMEYGGVVTAASLPLDTLEVSEDPTDLSLTLFSGSQHGGSLKGLQLYVRFGESGWAVWVPQLRRAIGQKHRPSS